MQSRNIIRLDKYTMEGKTIKETGVGFIRGSLTFSKVYHLMKDIKGLEPLMGLADAFRDYMIEDVSRGRYYTYINSFDYPVRSSYIETMTYSTVEEKEKCIDEFYFDNPYFYIERYFSDTMKDFDGNEGQSVKFELNKFLKRLGFKMGTVGEKHFSYYVSDIENSEIFIQDLYYDENFCSAVVINEVTGEEAVAVEEIHIERNMEFIDIASMVSRTQLLKSIGEIFLVDNYFAEQFDDVSKVREVITKEYLLLR